MTSIPARAAHRTATRMIATGALAGALVAAIAPQRPQQLTRRLAPPGQSDIKDGETPSGSGDVEAQADDATASGTFQVTLAGKKQQSVGPVSGKVADQQSDKPLPNATV